jgi:exopolysaccharide biosynthesis protein
MTNRLLRGRGCRTGLTLTVLTACGFLVAGTGVGHATADDRVRTDRTVSIAPGVTYQEFSLPVGHGTAYGSLLTADLADPHVAVDLLTSGAASRRETVSAMADEQGAVAGVNADFFDNSEAQHPGVAPTGAAVGPAIGDGVTLKAAVPDGQRFGPSLPPGTSTRDVIGVGADRVARLDRLSLSGSVTAGGRTLALGGFNQYALPVNGIGAYTSLWGAADRERAVCGTDHHRSDPCTEDTYEVTVRQGKVWSVSGSPGYGSIARGDVVLVGREDGAGALQGLRVGESVKVAEHLTQGGRSALRFAVGGFPVLRDGMPLGRLDDTASAIRTSAGFGDGGHRFYLMALDADHGAGAGITIAETADLMRALGADSAVDLDGGGSTTVVAREPGDDRVTVANHPSDGSERPVPEGVGFFSR